LCTCIDTIDPMCGEKQLCDRKEKKEKMKSKF